MTEKCCVFVDGENLRHSIVDLFDNEFNPAHYLPKRADWAGFFDWLVDKISNSTIRLRTYWYVIEEVDFAPYLPLPKDDPVKLKKILSKHELYRAELSSLTGLALTTKMNEMVNKCDYYANRMKARAEGWRRMQDGISTNHRAIEFRRAGAIRYNLFTGEFGNEKAVDVKLSIDMSEMRQIYDIALIVSGDGDYVPAVQAIKDSGKTVVNVAFEARNGRLLPGGARRLNRITDTAIIVQYADAKRFLKI